MTRVPVPNSWITYDTESTTKLSYAFQVAPSPLVASVAGEDPTMASLQVVITNPTGVAITVNSVTFVVPIGTGPSLMQTTANVETNVSDTIHWSFPPPSTTVTTGTFDFTLDPAAGTGVLFDAGASVVVEIYQFETVLAPTTASITVKEFLNDSGTPNFGPISVTTFPAGFFFNGLTASVPSGSGLTPVAQVAANTAVTLTWNSSVVETGKITILYTDAAEGQQSANPSDAGEWTSPGLTTDTVFTVSVEAAQIGGAPIVASMTTPVSVQNPALIAGSIAAGSATVTGTTTLSGATNANAIAATGLTVNGGTQSNGTVAPLTVTINKGAGSMVTVQNVGTGNLAEASINYTAGQLGWNVGVGGGATPGVFFFWNPTGGIVVTIDPSGTMTVTGTLNVVGGLVIPKNPDTGLTPNVPNAQPGQIMWDEHAIWIYIGTQWYATALSQPPLPTINLGPPQ
ncbi:MAG TPA: hypothetical protein VEK57_17580 [Thermoanaerobaculia bacterium]|nr:hypothetical protein [Thermoanaerobaculia bacterium]